MKNYHTYQSCIEACLKCASICNHCASSCTQEEDVKMMARCIQLDMECSAACYAAAQLMSLGSNQAKEICMICAQLCDDCGNECGKHKHMEHCQECAESCRKCAEECRKMAA
ncbi:MAG: four-helix bundle copper-binding protein [Chitinophagaceae bacterium]